MTPDTEEKCCAHCFEGGDYQVNKCKKCPCHSPISEKEVGGLHICEIAVTQLDSRFWCKGCPAVKAKMVAPTPADWEEEWIAERTEAVSVMLDNPDEYGIYSTTKFFNRIDGWLRTKKQEWELAVAHSYENDPMTREHYDRIRAEERSRIKELVERMMMDEGEDEEGMCPNCCTPWKCNGPHITDPEEYNQALSDLLSQLDT